MAGRLNKEEEKQSLKNQAMMAGGGAAGYGGVKALQNANKGGRLSGVSKFYHNTPKENVSAIMEEGIKKSKAIDPNNLTNQALKNQIDMGYIKPEDIADKVYLGKKLEVADNIGRAREARKMTYQNMFDLERLKDKNQKNLNVNIPYEDLKKMKSHANPELMGSKNHREYIGKLNSMLKDLGDPRRIHPDDMEYKQVFQHLGKDTKVLGNDIAPKYIKGSKHYKRQNLKGVLRYAKNNPKRFAKGLGMASLGVGGVAGGAALIGKGIYNQDKLYKKVNDRIEENRRLKREERLARQNKMAFEIVEYEFNKIANELFY